MSVALGDEPAATAVETADAPVDRSIADAYRTRLAYVGLNERTAAMDRELSRSETGAVVAETYRSRADASLIFEASIRAVGAASE